MNALLIDSDVAHLAALERLLRQDGRFEAIHCCAEPGLAWPHLRRTCPDIVFLDTRFQRANDRSSHTAQDLGSRLPETTGLLETGPPTAGIALAGRIRKRWPWMQLIFISADIEYAYAACQTFPLAFLTKPLHAVQLQPVLQRLFMTAPLNRNPAALGGMSQPSALPLPSQSGTAAHALRCFGEYEIVDSNAPSPIVRMPSRFGTALLAYLISRFDRTVGRPELMADLMPDRGDDRAVNLLHVHLHKLRQFLDQHACLLGGIAIQGHYRLTMPDGVCDLVDFARFVRSLAPVTAASIDKAEAMAALYRGPCFSSEDYPWADALRHELDVAHEQLLLQIAECRWAQNEPQLSERALKSLVQFNPLSEEGHCILLDQYLRRQERRKFLSGFEQYQKILCEELGIPADRHFQQAYQQLR